MEESRINVTNQKEGKEDDSKLYEVLTRIQGSTNKASFQISALSIALIVIGITTTLYGIYSPRPIAKDSTWDENLSLLRVASIGDDYHPYYQKFGAENIAHGSDLVEFGSFQKDIGKYLSDFFLNTKSDSIALRYFAEKVTTYYDKEGLNKEQVKKEIQLFNKKYEFDKINPSTISYNIEATGFNIFCEATFQKVKGNKVSMIYQIKLNQDFKVVFIRTLAPTTFDKTFDNTFQ